MDAHTFFPLSQAFSLPARLELRFEEAPQEAGFQRLSDLLRGEFKNERVLGVAPPSPPPTHPHSTRRARVSAGIEARFPSAWIGSAF